MVEASGTATQMSQGSFPNLSPLPPGPRTSRVKLAWLWLARNLITACLRD